MRILLYISIHTKDYWADKSVIKFNTNPNEYNSSAKLIARKLPAFFSATKPT